MADHDKDQTDPSAASIEGELDQLLAKVDDLTGELDRESGPAQAPPTPADTTSAPQAEETPGPAATRGEGKAPPPRPAGQADERSQAPSDASSEDADKPVPRAASAGQTPNAANDEPTVPADGADSAPEKPEPTESGPPATDGDDSQNAEFAGEVPVDANTEQVADEEIQQAVARLEEVKKGQEARASGEALSEDADRPANVPSPFKAVLVFLAVIDHMFLWLPRRAKDCLGYFALSTLLLGTVLWMLILFF